VAMCFWSLYFLIENGGGSKTVTPAASPNTDAVEQSDRYKNEKSPRDLVVDRAGLGFPMPAKYLWRLLLKPTR